MDVGLSLNPVDGGRHVALLSSLEDQEGLLQHEALSVRDEALLLQLHLQVTDGVVDRQAELNLSVTGPPFFVPVWSPVTVGIQSHSVNMCYNPCRCA